MTKQTTQTENWEQAEVKSNFVKFNKVGDFIKGTVVDIFTPDKDDVYGKRERKVVLKALEGEWHETSGEKVVAEVGEEYKVSAKEAIEVQIKKTVIGNVMMFKYTEQRKSKTAGYQPTKIITAFYKKDAEGRPVVERPTDNTEATYSAADEEAVQEAVDNF